MQDTPILSETGNSSCIKGLRGGVPGNSGVRGVGGREEAGNADATWGGFLILIHLLEGWGVAWKATSQYLEPWVTYEKFLGGKEKCVNH